MKKTLMILLGTTLLFAACASPESRSEDEIDTTQAVSTSDTTGTDTVTYTGSTSGDNGAGADTTDMKRQKATRQQGNE